jgi:hypothetical protein
VNAALSRGTIVRRLWLLLVAAACSASSVQAHEVRPAYLEIRETSSGTFDVLWKVPARGEYRLSLHVRLPGECRGAPLHGSFVGGAFIEQWQASCPNGLVGGTIAIDGLSATRTDVLARLERVDGTTQTVRLTPEQTSFVVAAAPTALEVSGTYFMLGVEHILLGIDHLLFVLGLLLLVRGLLPLVKTITAFTVAHSITLGASVLGYIPLDRAPIEAAIALSIVLLAREIVVADRGLVHLTHRKPWLVAFVFGLLHGLGFAGALGEIGLPPAAIPAALLFFNLGVEAGQLVFVLVLLAAHRLLRGVLAELAPKASPVLGYALGALATLWFFERLPAVWGG